MAAIFLGLNVLKGPNSWPMVYYNCNPMEPPLFHKKCLLIVYLSSSFQPSVSTMDFDIWFLSVVVNILKPIQNGCHFPDDIFKCSFLNENVLISIKISLKFVPKGPINNIPALVQIMAWHQPGDKPLSEPMMVILSMHICVTRPQWVKISQWLS